MNKAEKWAVIINPTAGNGFAATYADTVKKAFKDQGIDPVYVETMRKGHASELAEKFASDGFTHIIAVGGDGTVNEIAKPLLGNVKVTLGLIPAGTGNDFNQILGFPDRFDDISWDTFFMRNTILMDVGMCNGKHFLNGMGLGFDAQVAAENYEDSGEVKRGGKGKYIWHILKTLLFFREKKMLMSSHLGEQETDCFINTISIGRRFAGGFYLTPNAIANDGFLDVCNIKKLNLFQRLKILLMVPKGTHLKDKKVNYYQIEKLSLKFPEVVPFHVDGELFFDNNFDVTCQRESINIIFDPNSEHFFKI